MKDQWNLRYSTSEYVYGTEPNDVLRELEPQLLRGSKILCLADGEGRNGVFLAERGHSVTSVDASVIGLEKAQQLALERGVEIKTVVADLAEFDLGTGQWDAIVSIFCHVPPPLRAKIHSQVSRALRKGGVFLLEAYTPDQLQHHTGGPPFAELMMSETLLRSELTGMEFEFCEEREREIQEGALHNGISSVVQCFARRIDP
ncbi:MAG TPA: class I SAM-dependent methyltransferase [Candidatus Didemnitutus sp.]|nr:class I SAM-dependent methyltransferase [Candidatus Didemnitutus sp.]